MASFNFCQILTESAVYSCRNRHFGLGSGSEFKDLVTLVVVFTHEAL